MFNKIVKEFKWGQHNVRLETGEIARQAGGAVIVDVEDTVVLATVVGAKTAKPGQDFFPLTVDYLEKTYAAGKIPGGFFRREGRPSEGETLISRLIDRPLRPLFPEGFYNEVQVVIHVLSLNPDIPADIPALIGASAALAVSGLPFNGPVGAARVAYINNEYVLNPTRTQMKESALDLIVAGTERAVLMVESEAKQLSEEVMLGGVVFGHEQMQTAIDAIHELVRDGGKPEWDWQPAPKNEALIARVTEIAQGELLAAYQLRNKQARSAKLKEVYAATSATLEQDAAAVGHGRRRQGDGRQRAVRHRSEDRPLADPERRAAHRRPRHPHGAPDRNPHGRAAAHARLGALHARRNAGARRRDARHEGRRTEHRRARRRISRALHAPLQHAAVRDRRNGPRRFAEAP